MQNLIFYVSAASTLGVAKDSLGVKNVALPTIIRGGEVCLKMRLFAGDGDDTPLPLDELTRCTAWEWAMDSDFDESTNYKLVADNANITVGSVTETDPEGVEHTYTEISIPIPATNTEELKEWLGSSESQNNLNGELAGYDATGKLTYILQLKGFTIRNRILSAGDPTELPEQYLDEAGVRALIGAGAEAQCATAADAPDGDWVDSTTAPDTHVWIRWRLRGNPSGAWSTPAKRIPGPAGATGDKGDKGDTGATGLVEIVSIEMTAPATSPSITEAEGSTAEHRKYILHIPRGEKGDTGTDGTDGADGAAAGFGTPTVTVETLPAGSDATASVTASGVDTAKVFNFNFGIPKGADGSGTGDMLKSVYDTDDDGIVDHAAAADAVGATTAAQVADAVGKAHTHANKATLDKLAEADGKLTYDGAEIGGSGTVKSVNGQLPDESGNVTIETGGAVDESRLLPENPANGDIPCFDTTATVGGGNDANTRILLHFDADEIKDEAAGNAAPVTITKKTGTITVVEGGKWGKCAKYVTGSMTVATNLDELNANNWVVSGWFNPDENNHGVSYPTWLSMDDQNTHGFGFDSTGRYGESDGPLFYLDTPPASGTWHWLAIVKYSGGLRFYLNGAFLNEISAQQRANFCSTLAIGGFAGTHAAGSTERTFSGLVDEVRLQYIPDDEITLWTGTSIAVPDAPYSKPQTVGEWGKFNKSELAMKSDVFSAWHQLSGSSAITLDRADGELQKVTLTQNCTLTAPVLSAETPTLLLQVTSSSAVTVTVGETNIVTDHTGTFQVGWYWDGSATRRYPAVEVA